MPVKEWKNLATPELPPDDNLALGIDAADLKSVLRDIPSDRGNFHLGCQPKDQDRYGRIIAVCWLGAEDLGAWMASEGWALAYPKYSTDYVLHEGAARQGRRGLWRGEFQAPWEWRSARRNQ